MRIWDLATGPETVLSHEEYDLVESLIDNPDRELNEREQVLADRLVSRNVLERFDQDEDSKYGINWKPDVWRD